MSGLADCSLACQSGLGKLLHRSISFISVSLVTYFFLCPFVSCLIFLGMSSLFVCIVCVIWSFRSLVASVKL